MEAIYGINPVKEALRREDEGFSKIIVAAGRNMSALQEIIAAAEKKKIPVEFHPKNYLNEITGFSNHQGIVALRRPFIYSELDVLINNRRQPFQHDFIITLDSVMDPQNLGAIIRTAHCLGANGIVIPVDRAAPVTPAVIKASAGSAQQIPVARVVNLSQTIDFFKEAGFWIYGAEARTGEYVEKLDFNCNVVLVMGGEARGMRPLVRKKCDYLISIPIAGDFDSLNVAVAAGIIQYEIFRHRSKK